MREGRGVVKTDRKGEGGEHRLIDEGRRGADKTD